MRKYKEEELKKIVELMQESELEQLPNKETLQKTYKLSDTFYDRMSGLQKRMVRKEKFKKQCSVAAAVFALLFFVLHPQVTADVVPRYTMEYVPDGYELESDDYYENEGVIIYSNGEDNLRFLYYISDAGIQIDSNNIDYSVLEQNGKRIYYFESSDKNMQSDMQWLSDDENVAFNIHGCLSKKEMLAIMEGIKEK